jgi:cytochrome c-type biogenesis protein CcmH/NrfG
VEEWEAMEVEAAPEEVVWEAPELVAKAAPDELETREVEVRPFAEQMIYLREHPRDYETWLELARAQWQINDRWGALESYGQIVRAGKLLDQVIPDLETCLEQWPHITAQRLLGDAYMKDGRLSEALHTYRRALDSL